MSQFEKKEAIGYGRISLGKKTDKPYFSLTMIDQYGQKAYNNGFLSSATECFIDPITMQIAYYVEDVFVRGAFGSSGTRKVETVAYIEGQDGKTVRQAIDVSNVSGNLIRTILFPLKSGPDAKYPHVTFYKQDGDGAPAEEESGGKPDDKGGSNQYSGEETDPF